MTCWIFGRPSPSFQNTKIKIPHRSSPRTTHLGPSLAPWLYIVLLNSGNGRQMVVLVGGFASRPMTDEMRGRDVRGGACVLFGRVANPTFRTTQNKRRSENEEPKARGNDDEQFGLLHHPQQLPSDQRQNVFQATSRYSAWQQFSCPAQKTEGRHKRTQEIRVTSCSKFVPDPISW